MPVESVQAARHHQRSLQITHSKTPKGLNGYGQLQSAANLIVRTLHHHRENILKNEKDACIECQQKVANDDPAVSCDRCQRWQHIICNDLASQEIYERFLDHRSALAWKCRRCSKPMTSTPQK